MHLDSEYCNLLYRSFRRQGLVIHALMLRNIRTRFFGHGFGYFIAVGWPLTHIIALILLFEFSGRISPYGESSVLFVATGAIPFMIFSYLSRFMMLSVLSAKPLLAFPEVSLLDVLISGALVEFIFEKNK